MAVDKEYFDLKNAAALAVLPAITRFLLSRFPIDPNWKRSASEAAFDLADEFMDFHQTREKNRKTIEELVNKGKS